MCQVQDDLSKIPGLVILLIRLHGGYCRKKLVSPEKVWENFFLIRIRLEYKIGNETRKTTQVIYPSDVYRYGRQTLNVVEEAAELRYKEKKSWLSMEDALYTCYEFSLNRIKRMINRVSLVFERLLTSQTIRISLNGDQADNIQPFLNVVNALNVEAWICSKMESFEQLTFSYRDKMLYGPIYLRHKHKIFSKDLFSPATPP